MATIKGKWMFNEVIDISSSYLVQYVNFKSNDFDYQGFLRDDEVGRAFYYSYDNGQSEELTAVYDPIDNIWLDETYRRVDFGETDKTIDGEFYNWFIVNATEYVEPTPGGVVTIEYNNAVVATLAKGVATLPCEDKVMHTDVVITVPKMSGEVIPEWDGSYTVSGGVELIDFTIGGTAYQAESGMTWGEWVESEYNTDGAHIDGVQIFAGAGKLIVSDTSNAYAEPYVAPEEVIVSGYAYKIHSGGPMPV